MALNICAEGYTSSKIVLLRLGLTDKAAIWELKQRYETWATALPVPAQTLLNPLCARLYLKPWTLPPWEQGLVHFISSLEKAQPRQAHFHLRTLHPAILKFPVISKVDNSYLSHFSIKISNLLWNYSKMMKLKWFLLVSFLLRAGGSMCVYAWFNMTESKLKRKSLFRLWFLLFPIPEEV